MLKIFTFSASTWTHNEEFSANSRRRESLYSKCVVEVKHLIAL